MVETEPTSYEKAPTVYVQIFAMREGKMKDIGGGIFNANKDDIDAEVRRLKADLAGRYGDNPDDYTEKRTITTPSKAEA